MGVLLTPIIAKETITLETLRGRQLAVDGNGELYQFLALIRLRDGTPLRDSKGRIDVAPLGALLSHDAAHRRTRAGARVRVRRRAAGAEGAGDRQTPGRPRALRSGARRGDRRRRPRARLLEGDDDVEVDEGDGRRSARAAAADGSSERAGAVGGEAQAAHMAAASPESWAAASKDYDALLFGAPRLVRFLTISGKEFLPSQGTFRPIVPEVLDLAALLASLADHPRAARRSRRSSSAPTSLPASMASGRRKRCASSSSTAASRTCLRTSVKRSTPSRS